MNEIIAYSTMIMTVGLVLTLPRTGMGWRIGPAGIAAQGVLVLMLAGIVSLADLGEGVKVLWRPFIAILSIMLTTSTALHLGILDHVANVLAPRQGQSIRRVFASVFAFSALTSAVLNNDAAVLLLTPMIVQLIRRCYPERPDLLVPFAFVVFCAAGVAPLMISNPMNLIVAEYAGIGFNEYAARMIPISIVGWVATYAVLRVVFRRELDTTEPTAIANPATEPLSRPAWLFVGVLVLSLASYPVLSYVGGPVWGVAAVSALLGVWLCWRYEIASPRGLAAGLSWEILIFLFCVFVLVLGLRNVGLVDRMAAFYSVAIDPAAKILTIGITSALGSAILNNHPMAILNALAIHDLPRDSHQLILAALVGGDLGPRLLPVGSLAGLLWLDLLRRRGVYISTTRFILVGLPVTIPSLGLSLVVLLLMS